MRHLSRLIIKVVLLLLVAGVCGFFILKWHFKSAKYRDEITSQISGVLGADEIEASGFARTVNSGEFQRLGIEGGEESFFYAADFEGFSGVFSYLAGVTEPWRPTTIQIRKADLRLKAGGRMQEMQLAFSPVLESLEGKGISQIKIDDCSFDWGYSKLTFGAVRNTNFKATLQGGEWEVELSGGSFTQNWLGPLELKKGVLRVGESGIRVASLNLGTDEGSLELDGRISGPLNMPAFDLKGDFTALPLEKLIRIKGVNTREYIEGRISGSLSISGSSNRQVELSGQVRLGENEKIRIRERWSLFRALSILDSDRTYLRIDFDQGGFAFSTGGGGLKVTGIDLTAGDKARLLGDFQTRLPTQEEAAKALGIKLTSNFSSDLSDATDSSAAQQLENDRMRIDSRYDEEVFGVDIDGSVERENKRITESQLSWKELEALRMKREMEIHRITGELKVGVPAAAFSGSEVLLKLYPKDETGWRWIPVKLLDENFMTISDEAKELLLRQAKVSRSGPAE